MTQPHSADVQRLSTPSGPGNIRTPVRPNAPVRWPTDHSRQNSQIIELTDDAPGGGPDLHPAKRRRLDEAGGKDEIIQGGRTLSTKESGPQERRRLDLARPRPPQSFSALLPQATQPNTSGPESRGKVVQKQKPPPLPVRPWKHKSVQSDGSGTHTGGSHSMKDFGIVQATAFRLDPPSEAPRYKEDRVADFLPWSGKNIEDVMSENTAKQGYYDRQISQNETGTARPSLYSIFKHKTGLEVLSSLFSRAVEERKAHGKIISTSNFKPPPRVTLTEAKRKAWLSDLANAEVPLRKLSRTIPQGIRGQQLLDQSLQNSVPVSRAVWFAKCVGANEIRTLKRKGTSGTVVAGAELKWLREWTGGVTSFFNDIITSCGQENWKGRMSYALNMVSRLYQENMLDKDCFVEWLTSSVAKSKLDMLPVWLTVSRGFLEDIVRLRRHGRIMSEALLQKLKEARSQDTEDFIPLVETLSQVIRAFAHSRPLLFLLPQHWNEYRDSFKSCLELDEAEDRNLFSELSKQNLESMVVRDQPVFGVTSAKQQVIGVLDSGRAPFEIEQISQNCLEAGLDHNELVAIVIQWAATPFRTCTARKYLAVALLRLWHGKGIDVDEPVKAILLENASASPRNWDIFFHITSDLIRSQTISISRFLQMAIARGAINTGRVSDSPSSKSPILRMIEEAPMVNMPSHVKNLRTNILKRAGVSVESEVNWVVAYQAKLCKKLPSLFASADLPLGQDFSSTMCSPSSRCGQLEVARWVFNHIAKRVKDISELHKYKGSAGDKQSFIITYDEFLGVRTALEELDDMPILADILRHVSVSEDETTLTAIVETLNAHFGEFSAIGALEPLSSLLFGQYLKLRASSPARTLTISLLNLVSNMQTSTNKRRQLLEDLARGAKNVAIAACSPISDYMAESLQQAGQSFIDEFDQLLSTGNIMDDQAMSRLFHTLIERIESSFKTKQEDIFNLCHMLFRLMAFRPKQYEQLLHSWMKRLLQTPQPSMLSLLIGIGVMSLEDVLEISSEFILSPSSADTSKVRDTIHQNLLSLFDSAPALEVLKKDSIIYRLEYCRNQCLSSLRPGVIKSFGTIRNDVLAASRQTSSADSWTIRHLLQHPLPAFPNSHLAMQNAALPICRALGITADLSEKPLIISSIVRINDPFSLGLRVELLSTLYNSNRSENAEQDGQDRAVQLLFEAIQDSTRDTSWLTLVAGLGVELMRNIRQRAEEAFLALSPPLGQIPDRDQTAKSREILIDIATKTSFTVPENGVMATISTVSERIQTVLRFISVLSQQQAAESSEHVTIWTDDLRDYVCQLLRLIMINHRPSFPASASASSQAQSQLLVRTLLLLTSLALHPSLQTFVSELTDHSTNPLAALPARVFNTAAILSDSLPEEPRVVLARHLKDRMRDPTARFLFGSLNADMDSLSVQDELVIMREKAEGKEQLSAEYKVKNWELIQAINAGGGATGIASGGIGNDTGMSLCLFQGRIITSKDY